MARRIVRAALAEVKTAANNAPAFWCDCPGVDPTGKVAERLKNINGAFAVAEFTVKLALKFEHLGDSFGAKKIYEEDLPKLAKNVNEYATEIESKLGL